MSEEQTLDEIFDGDEPAEVVDAVVETAETVEVEEKPTVETEEAKPDEGEVETTDTPTVSKEPEETVEDLRKKVEAFQTKSTDERRKRQALEQQIQEQQKPKEDIDAFAEPDKAIQFATEKLRQDFDTKLFNISEVNAKSRYKDYDAMADLFLDKLQHESPHLAVEARNSVDVCDFIYKAAKNHAEMSALNEAGGVEAYKANLKAELRAEWEAEQKAETNKVIEQRLNDSIPASLSNTRAAGSNKSELTLDDEPLSKLF